MAYMEYLVYSRQCERVASLTPELQVLPLSHVYRSKHHELISVYKLRTSPNDTVESKKTDVIPSVVMICVSPVTCAVHV